jgi:hypothetical protein
MLVSFNLSAAVRKYIMNDCYVLSIIMLSFMFIHVHVQLWNICPFPFQEISIQYLPYNSNVIPSCCNAKFGFFNNLS